MQFDSSGSYKLVGHMPDELTSVKRYYFVESDGNLLVVAEAEAEPEVVVRVNKFRVFKFLAGCENRWEEMKDLGNRTIFVGDKNTSFWVNKASGIPGFVGNSVCSFCTCEDLVIYNLKNDKLWISTQVKGYLFLIRYGSCLLLPS